MTKELDGSPEAPKFHTTLFIDRDNRKVDIRSPHGEGEVLLDQRPAMFDMLVYLAEHQGEEIREGDINSYLYSHRKAYAQPEHVGWGSGELLTKDLRRKIDYAFWVPGVKPSVLTHDIHGNYALNAEVVFVDTYHLTDQEVGMIAYLLSNRHKKTIKLPSNYIKYTLEPQEAKQLEQLIDTSRQKVRARRTQTNENTVVDSEKVKATAIEKITHVLAADDQEYWAIFDGSSLEAQQLLNFLTDQNENKYPGLMAMLLQTEPRDRTSDHRGDIPHAGEIEYVLPQQPITPHKRRQRRQPPSYLN